MRKRESGRKSKTDTETERRAMLVTEKIPLEREREGGGGGGGGRQTDRQTDHVADASLNACFFPSPVGVCLLVGWLPNVPATGECISGTDLLRQFYVLSH